jgi:hypothetical protein
MKLRCFFCEEEKDFFTFCKTEWSGIQPICVECTKAIEDFENGTSTYTMTKKKMKISEKFPKKGVFQ